MTHSFTANVLRAIAALLFSLSFFLPMLIVPGNPGLLGFVVICCVPVMAFVSLILGVTEDLRGVLVAVMMMAPFLANLVVLLPFCGELSFPSRRSNAVA